MELGGLTANLPRSQPNPNAYLKTIEPSATLYSWVMNNHWHTNYRADQEGETTFRYYLRPHGAYDAVAAARFGLETTQPLIVVPARGDKPAASRLPCRTGRRAGQRPEAQRRRQGDHRAAVRGMRQRCRGQACLVEARTESRLAERRQRAAAGECPGGDRSAGLGHCHAAGGISLNDQGAYAPASYVVK